MDERPALGAEEEEPAEEGCSTPADGEEGEAEESDDEASDDGDDNSPAHPPLAPVVFDWENSLDDGSVKVPPPHGTRLCGTQNHCSCDSFRALKILVARNAPLSTVRVSQFERSANPSSDPAP